MKIFQENAQTFFIWVSIVGITEKKNPKEKYEEDPNELSKKFLKKIQGNSQSHCRWKNSQRYYRRNFQLYYITTDKAYCQDYNQMNSRKKSELALEFTM